MPAKIADSLVSRVEAHFADYPLAWRLFLGCLEVMHMDPYLEWTDTGVLRARRWYPCIEFHPQPDALVLHLDLYGIRKHRRLRPVEPQKWNALRLTRRSQIDEQVAAWLCEALDIGNLK